MGSNDEIACVNAETGAMNDEIDFMNDETRSTSPPKKYTPCLQPGWLADRGCSCLWLVVFFGFHINGKINRSHIAVIFLVNGKTAV
jgi:hypothetical protein